MDGNETKRLGRRALLVAGAAGVAAAAAQAVAAPADVFAADHSPLMIGESNAGSTQTFLHSESDNALVATSASKNGLTGGSDAVGQSGCYAWTSNLKGYGLTARSTAGHTSAQLAGGYFGAWAANPDAKNYGYLAHSAGAVLGHSNEGFGLIVSGKIDFKRSGILTIGANKQSAVVPNIPVTATSFVVATLVGYRSGVWVAGATPNVGGNSITIHLNKKVASAVKVGWVVLDRANLLFLPA